MSDQNHHDAEGPQNGNGRQGNNDESLDRLLGLKEVFSISAGAMISSGLFVLPAIVYAEAGPAVLFSYVLAALFVLPTLFSKAELATAMPRSGGTYFFAARSFGPIFGAFSGLSGWFSLALKSAFALVGIGIFLRPLIPFLPEGSADLVAVGFTVVFMFVNLASVKESGRLQLIFVISLLGILAFFVVSSIGSVDLLRFEEAGRAGWAEIFAVTGTIFVSYGGLTKVADVAEEVRNPGKTLPRGMLLAFIVVSVFYIAVIFSTIGILSPNQYAESMMPISLAAGQTSGIAGFVLLSAAAIFAFITTGNAGIMAASRSPMAMARDNLMPGFFARLSRRRKTPAVAIITTSAFMIVAILFLELDTLVKAASTMMLILFVSDNLSVIMMRQSRIVSYKPVFRSPGYPYLQIAGAVIYLFLIAEMGRVPLFITLAFFSVSVIWYFIYARKRITQKSAFVHMVQTITNRELVSDEAGLEQELLGILRERDEIEEDRFDRIIRDATVFDMKETIDRAGFFREVSRVVGERWEIDPQIVEDKLTERENQASTLIYPGVAVPHAIPHIVIEGEHAFDIVLVRNKYGIIWNDEGEVVYTAFCLVGSKDERDFHLKALMSIAQILQDPDFHREWMRARNDKEMRTVMLLARRRRK